MRTIHVGLDEKSIDVAISQLRNAKWIERKADELRRRIAEMIRDEASPAFEAAVADDLIGYIETYRGKVETEAPKIGGVNVRVEHGDHVSIVITDGKDAAFMEFGAGVYHNGPVGTSPNPLADEIGYWIGSYGKGNGAKQVWGYKGDDGYIHLTHGVPASMPLYRAIMAARERFEEIAREVFST